MSGKRLKLIHMIYGITLSLVICLCGALAIWMCIDIYKSGPSPFTRQSVQEHFMKISWAVYTLIALIFGGIVLNIVLPQEKKKIKGCVDKSYILDNFSSKLTNATQKGYAKIEREQILRFTMLTISCVLILSACIGAFVYCLTNLDIYATINGEVGTTNVNGQVIKGSLGILYFFLVPFAYTLVSIFVCRASIEREISLVKSELTSKDEEKVSTKELASPLNKAVCGAKNEIKRLTSSKKSSHKGRFAITCALGVIAIVFIIVGVANGGMADVLTKAIAICRECIGMG